MGKPRTKIGDVFSIPIDDLRVGYGQVAFKNKCGPLYIIVFRPAFERSLEIPISEIVQHEITIVGATMDARIYHGMWKIVGNVTSDRSRIPQPHFKVQIGNSTMIEDFDGNHLRKATPEDMQYYDNRWSRSPMGFESALKAIHGVIPWTSDYEKLTFEHATAQANNTPKKER